jgi:hypothetical protein
VPYLQFPYPYSFAAVLILFEKVLYGDKSRCPVMVRDVPLDAS